MKRLPVIAICLFFLLNSSAVADSYSDTIETFRKSPQVQPFFDDAYGYAVFPNVGKGGISIGGAYGKGLVYKGGQVTGETSLVKLTIGFQLGGQVFSEIIFFQDERAYNEFTSGSFEFDATASAVVITAGAQVQAGTGGASAGASSGPETVVQADTRYYKGMAVFIHAKGGLMYEAVVGGQRFSFKPL